MIWIGTNDGLNRYDGAGFMHYNVLSRPALCNGVVTALLQDTAGYIWIGTENGLNILDPQANTLQQFVHDDRQSGSLPRGPVRALQKMSDGTIWILSDKWLVKAGAHHQFSPVELHPSLLENNMVLVGLTEGSGRELWLSYLDHATALVQRRAHSNREDSLGAPVLWAKDYAKIYVDPQAKTWSLSCNGVGRYDTAHRKFQHWLKNDGAAHTPNLHVHTCYCADAEGAIWQGTERASLTKYDIGQKQATDYKWLLSAANATMVNFLYKDHNNNIWVGTDNGIVKISSRTSIFSTLPFSVNGTIRQDIRCRRIIEDRNRILYAGTENYGLLKRQPLPAGAASTASLSTAGAFPVSALPIRNNSIRIPMTGRYDIGFMYDMWYDHKNTIWMAGYGISRYDIARSTQEIFLPGGDEQARREGITQFSICFADSLFWTGGQFNLYTFNPLTKSMKPFRDNKGGMPFHNISCWSLAKKGKWIWAGTSGGLYKINSTTREVSKAAVHPVLENGINDIFIDGDGSFWISTSGGGILHYKEDTREIRQYTTRDGLSNNTVCGILADDNHNLWISTYAGLSYLDRQTEQFTSFFVKDGLNADEFNRKAFTRLADGRMIFGGLNGYIIFNPASAFKNVKPPDLLLTRFTRTPRFGKTEETIFGADTLKKVVIYPGDTFFSFGFTLTDMYDPARNGYSYTLKGLDQDWHSVGSSGLISFTSLPAGKYTLLIKGRIGKGVLAENEINVSILVQQAFYKTPWFICLMGLLSLAILYGALQYRINQLKKWQQLRTRIASDLHDEVGSSLVRITLLADAAKREGVKDSTGEQLATIAGISRGAVSTMKDVIWSIDARNDTMAGLINHMHEHIHNMLLPSGIEFEFSHAGLQENEKLSMNFRQHVYLIFKEAINNIVKHADAGRVEIRLEKKQGMFTMRISDNGKGMSRMGRYSGQGIRNMQMRAAGIKATLETSSRNGLTLLLTVPFR